MRKAFVDREAREGLSIEMDSIRNFVSRRTVVKDSYDRLVETRIDPHSVLLVNICKHRCKALHCLQQNLLLSPGQQRSRGLVFEGRSSGQHQ